MEAMQPAFEDETPLNPFDFWEGGDFKLKLRTVDGYWNYDKSEFDSPSPLFDDDEKIEEVWKKQYPLAEFTADTNFKSYDELKTRLSMVLAGTTTVGTAAKVMEGEPTATFKVDTQSTPNPFDEPVTVVEVSSNEEDDTLSYFEKLADKG